MKTTPVFFAFLAFATIAQAQIAPAKTELSDTAKAAIDPTLSREEVGKIKGVTCNEFESKAHEYVGQIIKLKFNYRDTDIEKSQSEPGLYTGMLQSYLEASRRKNVDSGWGMVNVLFAQEALPWFSRIPSNIDARSSLVVVGRVVEMKGGGKPQVVLIGREIKTDIKGSRAVW